MDTLRDEQLSVSWVSFVLNTFTSRSVRRFDPSHYPVQYPDLCDVPKCCAWSQCGEMLGRLQTSFVVFSCLTPLCPRTSSDQRHVNCARMVQTGCKSARVVSHRCHDMLTCHIEALCGVLRSSLGFVQNCIPTLAVVVFTWYLGHDSAPSRALKMRPADVVKSQNFHFSGCPLVASHASTEHELATLHCERGRKRAVRVFRCEGAHSSWFLAQPDDDWIRSANLVQCSTIEIRWLSTQSCPSNSRELHGTLATLP